MGESIEYSRIFTYVLQLGLTAVVGFAGWSIRNAIAELKRGIEKNAMEIRRVEEKYTGQYDKLLEMYNTLRSDLPLIYVTREDYIRTMDGVDKQMSKMDRKLDQVLQLMAKDSGG